MDNVHFLLIRPAAGSGLLRPAYAESLLHPAMPDVFGEHKEPDSELQIIRTFRVFRVEMRSVTRRENTVKSVYYVKESHILAARDIAVATAGKRGLRDIRVVEVSDPLAQA